MNAFLRAAAADTLGLGGWTYKIAAFVTRCGWPVTENTIKDAKRRGKLVLGTVRHLTAEEERFALMVFFVRPDCELDRFAAEGSPAHAALERLREEANEPAYDDDHIPTEVASGDWPLDEDELWEGVAGATLPYSASATQPWQR